MQGNIPVLSSLKTLFSLKDFTDAGGTRYQLEQFLKTEHVSHIKHGLYRKGSTKSFSYEEQFQVATMQLKNHRSAICLHAALSYYDLSDHIITEPIMLVDNAVTSRSKNIILFRKRDPLWRVGIDKKEGFCITSLDRTIVESLVYTKHTGLDGNHALRESLKENLTTISKLYDAAQRLNLSEKIRAKLEVFS